MPFAADSKMMMSNGEMIQLNSTFVSEGTTPAGSTWQVMHTTVGLLVIIRSNSNDP